jgi:hypothetical protein
MRLASTIVAGRDDLAEVSSLVLSAVDLDMFVACCARVSE